MLSKFRLYRDFVQGLRTSNSIILVQVGLEEVVNILSGCAQCSQTKAKGTTVTDNLKQKRKTDQKEMKH